MTISLDAGIEKFKEIKKENVLELFKDSFVEATGMLVPTTPFFAALETIVPKYLGAAEPIISKYLAFPELLPIDSIDARVKTIAAMYLGGGFVFSKLRDISRATFDVKKESTGFKKKFHDAAYAATIGIPAAVLLYYSNDDLSSLQIAQGTVTSTVASAGLGILTGLGIDYARDLMQNIKSVRVPDEISNLSKSAKYAIVGTATLASMAATGGVYEIKDYIDAKKEVKVNSLESGAFDSRAYDTTNDFNSRNLHN